MPSGQDRRNGFTALRLGAAFFVLLTHSYVLLGHGEEDPLARLTQFVPFSALGVDVFFAISGYLVCQSLLREASPHAYLLKRCLRILPALAVLVALTTFVVGPMFTTDPGYWKSAQTYHYLLSTLIYPWQGFLPGVFSANPTSVVNGSLWTLPLEVTCYLLLLAMSWCGALNPRGLALLTSGSLALHMVDAFLTQPAVQPTILSMGLLQLNRLGTIFCGGALLAALGERVVYARSAACAAAALILVALWWGQTNWHRFAFVYILLLPYVVITTALFLRRLDRLNRWDISYGFYLYAFLVQQCVVQVVGLDHLSAFRLTVLSVAGTLPCSMLSWILVERPALALKTSRTLLGRRAIPFPPEVKHRGPAAALDGTRPG